MRAAAASALLNGTESLQVSRELGINVKTVAKWRKRQRVEDVRMGPKEAHSTGLSVEEEALIVAFRRHTLLPLDDCLYALQPPVRLRNLNRQADRSHLKI